MALLGASSAAPARHRGHGSGIPGQFDYYLLSLSWSPAFCLESPDGEECHGPRRYGFIAHGLWPQNEHGWPEHCAVHVPVPDEVVRGIVDLMPARALIYHEWSAHGTCSGLPPAQFFALVRRAYASIVIPQPLRHPAATLEEPTAAVAAAFLRANPRMAPDSIVVTCSTRGTPELREVRLCLDRNLAPRSCAADAARSACRAPALLIPPVR